MQEMFAKDSKGLVLNKKKFVPSIQQAAYFDWIKNETGSCVLEAVAGSGKTTTLIQGLKLMEGTIFFGAFNKKICVEIESKTGKREGLTVSTMHAAGFSVWRKATRFVKVDGDKVRNIYREACFRNMQYSPFQGVVIQLVSLAKQSGFGVEGVVSMKSRNAWISLIDHHDIETFDENTGIDNTDLIIKLAIKTLEASIAQNMSIVDYDDMIFAPLYHNCAIDKFDWVLIDEAQDTNITRRLLALRMMKDTSRLVAVGDRRQAIYGFTGADSDALDLIGQATGAKELPLTTTYRCPKAVVKYAQQWVKHIQAAETAPEGIVRELPAADFFNSAQVGDAVLCRFNAPLVKYVYKFIAAGIPARIEGREIGKGLKELAKRWKVKSLITLSERLEKYREREVAKYELKEQPVKVQAIEDKCGCLKVIIGRVTEKDPHTKTPVELVLAEIDAIFGLNKTEAEMAALPVVLLSSIHKSKGREWPRVFWLQAGPNKRANLPWMLVQEDNLCYVAATRAMEELINIDIREEMKSMVQPKV